MRCSVPWAHGTSCAEKGAQDLSLTNCTEFMGPDRTAPEGTSHPFCSFTVRLTWGRREWSRVGRVWAGPGLPSLPLTVHMTQLCRSPHEELQGVPSPPVCPPPHALCEGLALYPILEVPTLRASDS